MAYNWPTNIVPNAQKFTFISYFQDHESPLTRTEQSNSDVSVLLQIEFGFPMLNQDDGLLALAHLGRAMRDEYVVPYKQAGVIYPTTDTMTLGAGATGSSLPIVGIPSGYAFKDGQLFSLIDTDGRRYNYQVGADSAAGAANRTITLNADIRKPHASGCVLEIKEPKIQGKIKPDNRVLDLDVAYLSQINFTIKEAR